MKLLITIYNLYLPNNKLNVINYIAIDNEYVTILDFVTMAIIIIGNVICTLFCSSFEHCNSDVIDFNGIYMFLNSRTVRT